MLTLSGVWIHFNLKLCNFPNRLACPVKHIWTPWSIKHPSHSLWFSEDQSVSAQKAKASNGVKKQNKTLSVPVLAHTRMIVKRSWDSELKDFTNFQLKYVRLIHESSIRTRCCWIGRWHRRRTEGQNVHTHIPSVLFSFLVAWELARGATSHQERRRGKRRKVVQGVFCVGG